MNREMKRVEEVPHLRVMLRMSDEAGRLNLVRRMRDDAIDVLRPLKRKVRRKRSKTLLALYRKNGASWAWQLDTYDAVEFCFLALRHELTRRQLAAVKLLLYCTIAIDDEIVTENARDRILGVYRQLDYVAGED